MIILSTLLLKTVIFHNSLTVTVTVHSWLQDPRTDWSGIEVVCRKKTKQDIEGYIGLKRG